jgi:hypothetical protein
VPVLSWQARQSTLSWLVKSKFLSLPAVAGVATGAARFVGKRRAAEIIGRPFLADQLARGRALGLPGPVDALHDLMAGHVVAAQAGLGDFRPGLERAFQGFELAVVGGGERDA